MLSPHTLSQPGDFAQVACGADSEVEISSSSSAAGAGAAADRSSSEIGPPCSSSTGEVSTDPVVPCRGTDRFRTRERESSARVEWAPPWPMLRSARVECAPARSPRHVSTSTRIRTPSSSSTTSFRRRVSRW